MREFCIQLCLKKKELPKVNLQTTVCVEVMLLCKSVWAHSGLHFPVRIKDIVWRKSCFYASGFRPQLRDCAGDAREGRWRLRSGQLESGLTHGKALIKSAAQSCLQDRLFCNAVIYVDRLCVVHTVIIILMCVCSFVREAKSQSGGLLPRLFHTGNSPQPVMHGVTASSCGKWCHTGRGHIGRCQIRMWVLENYWYLWCICIISLSLPFSSTISYLHTSYSNCHRSISANTATILTVKRWFDANKSTKERGGKK